VTLSTVPGEFFREEADSQPAQHFQRCMVQKLTGVNTREEKVRVMDMFRAGQCRLLISTEAAGMGCDVADIALTVVLGLDSTEWKLSQKEGRAGRDGNRAACVILVDPSHRGCRSLNSVFKARAGGCLRSGLSGLFMLTSPDGKNNENWDQLIHGTMVQSSNI
jgi:superfamily II DNA/RNA helicase